MSRVLVIDDDPGVRESMSRMLSQAGYTVRVAETGEEGFDIARAGGFDVILSDMRMPGLSGLDVLRQICATSGVDRVVHRHDRIWHRGQARWKR